MLMTEVYRFDILADTHVRVVMLVLLAERLLAERLLRLVWHALFTFAENVHPEVEVHVNIVSSSTSKRRGISELVVMTAPDASASKISPYVSLAKAGLS